LSVGVGVTVTRDQTIYFACKHCGAVYSAMRSDSPTEKVFLLFCKGYRNVLQDDTGRYSLTDLMTVLPTPSKK
jgi:hypothetical protein